MGSRARAAAACGGEGSQRHQPGTHLERPGGERATFTRSRDEAKHKARKRKGRQQRGLFSYPSVKEGISCGIFAALGACSSVKLLLQQSRSGLAPCRHPLPLLNPRQMPSFKQGSHTTQLIIFILLHFFTRDFHTARESALYIQLFRAKSSVDRNIYTLIKTL